MEEKDLPIVKELLNLLKFESVWSKSKDQNMPFGLGIAEAFKYFGAKAEADGFEVDYCDGYCLEIAYGKGVEIMMAAHIDVVPAAGWEQAFKPYLENGYIYGRGAQDDKGPLIACYFALKKAKEEGLIKNTRIRLVIGGNEENGSKCLDYYFGHLAKKNPDFAFTPDANFPLIYGEKGICNLILRKKINANIKSLSGGVALNVVPEQASVYLNDLVDEENIIAYCNSYRLNYKLENNCLTFIGKSAHGSTPELGINALFHLIHFLGQYVDKQFVEPSQLLSSYTGSSLGIYAESEDLGQLSINLGRAEYCHGQLQMELNIRYPETIDSVKILQNINKKWPDYQCQITYNLEPLLQDLNSPLVQILLGAYQKVSNDLTKPFTIGGGTYARRIKNCLAYGMIFPGEEELFHMKGERIKVSTLILGMNVYYQALVMFDKFAREKL